MHQNVSDLVFLPNINPNIIVTQYIFENKTPEYNKVMVIGKICVEPSDPHRRKLIPPEALSNKKYFSSLDGMLIHRRVTPTPPPPPALFRQYKFIHLFLSTVINKLFEPSEQFDT